MVLLLSFEWTKIVYSKSLKVDQNHGFDACIFLQVITSLTLVSGPKSGPPSLKRYHFDGKSGPICRHFSVSCHRFCRWYLKITDLDHFGDRSGGSCRDNTFVIIKRNRIYTFLDHLWFWTRRCFLHWWICYACAQVSRLKLRYWWHRCWHRGYWWHK